MSADLDTILEADKFGLRIDADLPMIFKGSFLFILGVLVFLEEDFERLGLTNGDGC